MKIHLGVTPSSLTAEDWYLLGDRTEGFSGSDLSNCTSDAMFEPLRELENTSRWKMNKGKMQEIVFYSESPFEVEIKVNTTANERNGKHWSRRFAPFSNQSDLKLKPRLGHLRFPALQAVCALLL